MEMAEYFTGKNSWIYYTNDKWKTYHKERTTLSGYIETNNSDIKFKITLRDHLGDARANIIINELEIIRNLLADRGFHHEKNGYGDEFEVFAISTLHQLDYCTCIEKNLILGSEDGKIDAIVVEDNIVNIYQIKLTSFDNGDIAIMQKNFEKFMRYNDLPISNTRDLKSFLDKHKFKLLEKVPQYKIISNNENSNFKPDDIYDTFFLNSLLPLNKNNLNLRLEFPERVELDNCNHSSHLSNNYNYANDDNMFVFIMPALDFVNAILNIEGINQNNDNLNKLFFDNVRGFLGVNKDIEYTLDNDPENFLKYSNGITITGEVMCGGYFLTINNPMISNGQQSLYTLLLNKDKLDHVKVLVIVKGENNQQIKMNIARNTNNQKQVKAIDLLSLNNGLRHIQKKLLSEALKNKKVHNKLESGFYLNIYQNGIKGYEKLVKNLFPNNRIITLRDFVRLYMSAKTTQIGDWKRNLNECIELIIQDTNLNFNYATAIKVCEVIQYYNDSMKFIFDKKLKNDISSSDLTLQYILFTYDYSFKEALMIVYYINEKNRFKYSKLIDLHKSNNVVKEIESAVKSDMFRSIEFPNIIKYYDIIKKHQSEYLNYMINNHGLKLSSANTYVLAISQICSLIEDQSNERINLFENKEMINLYDYEAVIKLSSLPEPSKRKLLNAYIYLKEYYNGTLENDTINTR